MRKYIGKGGGKNRTEVTGAGYGLKLDKGKDKAWKTKVRIRNYRKWMEEKKINSRNKIRE